MCPYLLHTSRNMMSRIPYGKGLYSTIGRNNFPLFKTVRSASKIWLFTVSTSFSSKSMKVAVLGAASKTGSCLSLFLKQSSLIDELAIYDCKCTYGLALDLNYIDTRCKVSTCNASARCLKQTLEGAKIVMIVGDRTIKKESSPDEILKRNADTLSDLLPTIIKYCPGGRIMAQRVAFYRTGRSFICVAADLGFSRPRSFINYELAVFDIPRDNPDKDKDAMVAVVMSPINSLIPLAMEMYKKAGVYEYNRLFGVISLDCVRANFFFAEMIGIEPECVTVPVIGGSCPETCVPIFTHAKPCNKLSQQEALRLTNAVRVTDAEISRMNEGNEASSIAMAFGAARFCVSLCKALRHQRGVVECAYVRSCVIPGITYFAAPLELGPDGIQKHLGIPPLNDYECKLLKTAVPVLKSAIALGEALALGHENISSEVCAQRAGSRQHMNSPHI